MSPIKSIARYARCLKTSTSLLTSVSYGTSVVLYVLRICPIRYLTRMARLDIGFHGFCLRLGAHGLQSVSVAPAINI